METFLQIYKTKIDGILHGFDRIIIKGHIQSFYANDNFYYFLKKEQVQLKDFKEYALKINEKIKAHIEKIKEETGCYSEYLVSCKTSKEEIAKRILKENPEKEGLICILSEVEPCNTLTVRYNKSTKKLEKSQEYRKCLHYYFYYNDKDFGLMHVRLQTWLPFGIQIYINGKEYLKKQLIKEQIEYTSYENSITSVADLEKAQSIADKFIEKKWFKTFDSFAKKVNVFLPRIEEIFSQHGYIWCIEQCEYASDILFKDRATLESVYPHFLEYASLCQMGENIFTFFGRKVHGNYQGEAVSDRKNYFGQGYRVKFTLDKNFLKMYDKSSVLRIETTINNSRAFKIHNPKPQGKMQWVPMGKNISNLYRYAQIAKKCNERYIESLAVLNRNNDIEKTIESLCQPKKTKLSEKSLNERQYSSFNPLKNFTTKLFNAIMNGAYFIKGFTNKELIKSLIALEAFTKEQIKDIKKLSAKITREIAKLRAHKLVQKLPHTFRYRVTPKGVEVLNRILMFKKLDLKVC
jgi:hypothetical protein